jgi:hypothetical protein
LQGLHAVVCAALDFSFYRFSFPANNLHFNQTLRGKKRMALRRALLVARLANRVGARAFSAPATSIDVRIVLSFEAA